MGRCIGDDPVLDVGSMLAGGSLGASRRITGLWSGGGGAPGEARDPATYAVIGTTTARASSTFVTRPMVRIVRGDRGACVRPG